MTFHEVAASRYPCMSSLQNVFAFGSPSDHSGGTVVQNSHHWTGAGPKSPREWNPWDDASGDRLRLWMGIDKNIFYDDSVIALVPMGFCYPGKGSSGDLPPRPECAPLWHAKLLKAMPTIQLTLLIGTYAQNYYLGDRASDVTTTVKNYKKYLPEYWPLVHPSPRNQIWAKKNPWFERDVVPHLQKIVRRILKN